MKKTYLAFIPLLSFVLAGCPASPTEPDDGYVHSVEKIRELDYAPDAEINGRVVVKGDGCYIIYDGTGMILHFSSRSTNSVQVGDKVTLKGPTQMREGLAQFGTDVEAIPYEGDVPEFNATPRKVTSVDGYKIHDIEYVTVENAIAYKDVGKDATYYQTECLEGDYSYYISMSDSLSSRLAPIEDTSIEAPLLVNMTGFIKSCKEAVGVFAGKSRVGLLLSETLTPVELKIRSLEAKENFPYYNLTTSFDENTRLEIHAKYQYNMDRLIPVKDVRYEVKNSEGEIIDTTLPFEEAGEYSVTVSYDGLTTEPVTFTVHNNLDKVAYKTITELALENSWDGSSGSKTYGVKEPVYLNEDIKMQLSGSGAYSAKNESWTLNQTQKITFSTADETDYYINAVRIDYGQNDGDEEGRKGILEYVPTRTLAPVGEKTIFYGVKNHYAGITNANIRMYNILVLYNETSIVTTPKNLVARDDGGRYSPYDVYKSDNKLHVFLEYEPVDGFDTIKGKELDKSEYSYDLLDPEGNNADPAKAFGAYGVFKVSASYQSFTSPTININVPRYESLKVVDKVEQYDISETFDAVNQLAVTAYYSSDYEVELSKGKYEYTVRDSEGNAIDTSKPFPAHGVYTVTANALDVVSNEIEIIVPAYRSIAITDAVTEYNRFSTFDGSHDFKVVATYTNGATYVIAKGRYTYVVKDADGNEIDTSKYFPAAGTYTVYVSFDGKDAPSFEITVINNTEVRVSKTITEMANSTLNNWTGTRYTEGKLDEIVHLKATGSSTGNYSAKNGTWSIVQKKTTSMEEYGYLEIDFLEEGFAFKSISMTYQPTSDDEKDNRVGYLEGLEPGQTLTFTEDVAKVKLHVIPVTEGTTNSTARITSITIEYKVLAS